MKGFIEVSLDNESILINVSQIVLLQSYTPTNDSEKSNCAIGVSFHHSGGKDTFYTVIESYDKVKELIEQAL